jgi:hypothetical protein
LDVLSAMGDYASNPGNFDWGSPVPFSQGSASGYIYCTYEWELDYWHIYMEINW